ncbi:hypothetical protein GCK32_011979 [Trichostrongylus colubriformis]|uniref:Uncharacterized protein n=1 Tax=Trichostrongylus colubriformis TaxID=6319 RepID=A0AAN8FAN2_TRICO
MERRRRERRATTPIPEDPFCTVLPGFVRAKDGNPIPSDSEVKQSKRESRRQERSTNQDGNGHGNRSSARPHRELSPTMLPGVRSIPREISETFKNQLHPGEYYAKSLTQYLGPFDHEPTEEELPSGDTYFILQSMGRIRETGKCVFRNVRQLTIPARELPARPISPSELPGVRALSAEIDEEMRRDLTPGKYYAKSMTRYLGPYDNIPTKDMLPRGESYVILQEMGRITTGLVLRKVTQLDC